MLLSLNTFFYYRFYRLYQTVEHKRPPQRKPQIPKFKLVNLFAMPGPSKKPSKNVQVQPGTWRPGRPGVRGGPSGRRGRLLAHHMHDRI